MDKVYKLIKKYRMLFIYCSITLISMILIYNYIFKNIDYISKVYIDVRDNSGVIGEILPDKEVKQTFIADKNISQISLLMATYNNKLSNGELSINIKKDDSIIFNKKVDINDIQDNKNLDIVFDEPLKTNKGEEYEIIINTYNTSEGNAPTIYINEGTEYESELYINGEKQAGSLVFKVYESHDIKVIKVIYISICVILAIFVIIMYYFIFIKKYIIEKIFLISSIVIGIMFMILMPPMTVPDERAHYDTAYRWSNVFMFKGIENKDGTMQIRNEDLKIYNFDKPYDNQYRYTYPCKYYLYEAFENFNANSSGNEISSINAQHYDGGYVYWISALGIALGRLMKLNYLQVFYLARLFNSVFYVFTVYWSIKIIPFGKKLIYALAMLPMALSLATGVSYDGIINAFAFMFIAYVLHIAYDEEKVKYGDIIILSTISMLLFSSKSGVYSPMLLMLLIIPIKRFENTKEYIRKIGGISLISILFYCIINLNRIVKILGADRTAIANRVNFETYPVSFIFTNFGEFFAMICRTIDTKLEFYVNNVIGNMLGYFETNNTIITMPIVYSFMIIILLTTLKNKDEKQYITKRSKAICLISSSASIGCVVIALFAIATVTGLNWIYGIQGRYFLPIIPMILICLRNSTVVLDKNIDKEIMMTIIFLDVLTILNLLINIGIK